MLIPVYLAQLREKERQLAETFLAVAHRHVNDAGVRDVGKQLADWSLGHAAVLDELGQRYGKPALAEVDHLHKVLFKGPRLGGIGLLRDLQDLSILAGSTRTLWTIVMQAALESKDEALAETCASIGDQTDRQLAWLCTQIKHTAPQVLLVPPNLKAAVLDKAKGLKPSKHKGVRSRPRVPANAGR